MPEKDLSQKSQLITHNYLPKGAATAIGSLPFTDPNKAVDLMLSSLEEVPAWPQLPKLGFKENMYTQYAEGLPSTVIDEVNERFYFNTDDISGLEAFYQKYLDEDLDYFKISADYAAGLHNFIAKVSRMEQKPKVLKGQVTGPISFGLTVRDQNDKAIIYNDQFADVVVKGLAMKAKWQEAVFNKIAPDSKKIIFFDEPYLVSFGSAFVALNYEDVLSKLDECFSAISAIKGIHVCGGTDWALIMQTKVDLIHFDAYEHFDTIALYPQQLNDFLKRGGILGWGITPHTVEKIEKENSQSLLKQLSQKIDKIISLGVDKDLILNQLLVAPSCGAGSLSIENATRALELSKEVSMLYRSTYF